MTYIYLVRHASVDYTNDINKDLYVSLSSLGKKQSIEMARLWRREVDIIYSSLLPRSFETIEPLAQKISADILKTSDFSELNYCGNAQLFHQELLNNNNFKFNGGETLSEANDRFLSGLSSAAKRHAKGVVVVSTHGTVLSEFLKNQFNFPDNCFFSLSYPDIYEISFSYGKFDFIRRVVDFLPSNSQNLTIR